MAEDGAYEKALARRKTLQQELAEIDEFIALYEKLIGASAEKASTSGRKRQRSGVPPRRLADLAKVILAEAGTPMTRSALANAIESRGLPLSGADKAKNLGTILWRLDSEFVNLPGLGYWLRDRPYPEAGYKP